MKHAPAAAAACVRQKHARCLLLSPAPLTPPPPPLLLFYSFLLADTCAICRNKLYEPSIEAQANPGLADDAGYSIAWGSCGHVFHLDCISRWLKTRSVCPLCNREWEFAKIEKIATAGPIG